MLEDLTENERITTDLLDGFNEIVLEAEFGRLSASDEGGRNGRESLRVERKGRNSRREVVEGNGGSGRLGSEEFGDVLSAAPFEVIPFGELIDGANDSESFVVPSAKIVVQREIR